MLVGYARVSTQDQQLDAQEDALQQAGCEKIYTDKVSGTQADRSGLAQALEVLREGDNLVVWKLDRLGRSLSHLVQQVNDLKRQGIGFKSLQGFLAHSLQKILSSKSSPMRPFYRISGLQNPG